MPFGSAYTQDTRTQRIDGMLTKTVKANNAENLDVGKG